MSFTPKSINDINDDFLKNMKAKYDAQNKENQNPSSKNLSPAEAKKDKADKNYSTPFDTVRQPSVFDEKSNVKVTKPANLEKEQQEPTPKDTTAFKTVKSEDKKKIKPVKTQPQNREVPKRADEKAVINEGHPKKAEVSNKTQNKTISDTKTQKIKSPVKKEPVQKSVKPVSETPKVKELKKEQTVPQKDSSQEKSKKSAPKEPQGDMYNDYFEEFLDILSSPEKKENNKAATNTAQINSVFEELDESKKIEKTSLENDKNNEKKANDNYNKSEENVHHERNYDRCFSSNSRALIAKAKMLRKLFLAGCILLVSSVLSIAILFTMSRFIPAKEIVEQSKKNEQIVEVNDDGDSKQSNEMRIECSFVESYSFSAFINTYYLHWVIVLSLILLGASIVFFSLYVRERGTGNLMKFIKSKKRKE